MKKFLLGAIASMAMLAAQPVFAADTFSPAQKAAIGEVVKDYLLENPEILQEVIQKLQDKQQAAQADAQKSGVAKYADALFNDPNQVVLGNPKGDVTLVEFFDYNCGYCKRAHADMVRLLQEDKKLRVILKEFPVLGPGSEEAAQVAVIVNEMAPQRYQAFHDELLMGRGEVNGTRALAVAADMGLDPKVIQSRIKGPEVAKTINTSFTLAQALGINGTPSYVVQNEVVVGAVGYDSLKEKIKSVRACGSASC